MKAKTHEKLSRLAKRFLTATLPFCFILFFAASANALTINNNQIYALSCKVKNDGPIFETTWGTSVTKDIPSDYKAIKCAALLDSKQKRATVFYIIRTRYDNNSVLTMKQQFNACSGSYPAVYITGLKNPDDMKIKCDEIGNMTLDDKVKTGIAVLQAFFRLIINMI